MEVGKKDKASDMSRSKSMVNILRRNRSQKGTAGIHRSKNTKDYTADREQLVVWTLRSQIIASSLAGATQLLLLAHTPVSRKVFQYMYCLNLSGKSLLIADYNISCKSYEYFAFLPIVLAVFIGYTVALPAIILFYLHRHRNELYSTQVIQRMGWLYDRYVRGAEFWQVHDVLLKMILTGVLIYIPQSLRAGSAAIICVLAVASLNYFRPHKNLAPFWLSEISWVVTTSKYVTALLLNNDTEDNQKEYIGRFLIGVDITFLISSTIALFLAAWMLRHKIKILEKREQGREAVIVPVPAPVDNAKGGLKDWSIELNAESSEKTSSVNSRKELRNIKKEFGVDSDQYKNKLKDMAASRKMYLNFD